MQEIDAIQNKRESKIISSINNDTSENGYIVFDYREKSGYRNFDTQDWSGLMDALKNRFEVIVQIRPETPPPTIATLGHLGLALDPHPLRTNMDFV